MKTYKTFDLRLQLTAALVVFAELITSCSTLKPGTVPNETPQAEKIEAERGIASSSDNSRRDRPSCNELLSPEDIQAIADMKKIHGDILSQRSISASNSSQKESLKPFFDRLSTLSNSKEPLSKAELKSLLGHTALELIHSDWVAVLNLVIHHRIQKIPLSARENGMRDRLLAIKALDVEKYLDSIEFAIRDLMKAGAALNSATLITLRNFDFKLLAKDPSLQVSFKKIFPEADGQIGNITSPNRKTVLFVGEEALLPPHYLLRADQQAPGTKRPFRAAISRKKYWAFVHSQADKLSDLMSMMMQTGESPNPIKNLFDDLDTLQVWYVDARTGTNTVTSAKAMSDSSSEQAAMILRELIEVYGIDSPVYQTDTAGNILYEAGPDGKRQPKQKLTENGKPLTHMRQIWSEYSSREASRIQDLGEGKDPGKVQWRMGKEVGVGILALLLSKYLGPKIALSALGAGLVFATAFSGFKAVVVAEDPSNIPCIFGSEMAKNLNDTLLMSIVFAPLGVLSELGLTGRAAVGSGAVEVIGSTRVAAYVGAKFVAPGLGIGLAVSGAAQAIKGQALAQKMGDEALAQGDTEAATAYYQLQKSSTIDAGQSLWFTYLSFQGLRMKPFEIKPGNGVLPKSIPEANQVVAAAEAEVARASAKANQEPSLETLSALRQAMLSLFNAKIAQLKLENTQAGGKGLGERPAEREELHKLSQEVKDLTKTIASKENGREFLGAQDADKALAEAVQVQDLLEKANNNLLFNSVEKNQLYISAVAAWNKSAIKLRKVAANAPNEKTKSEFNSQADLAEGRARQLAEHSDAYREKHPELAGKPAPLKPAKPFDGTFAEFLLIHFGENFSKPERETIETLFNQKFSQLQTEVETRIYQKGLGPTLLALRNALKDCKLMADRSTVPSLVQVAGVTFDLNQSSCTL